MHSFKNYPIPFLQQLFFKAENLPVFWNRILKWNIIILSVKAVSLDLII